MLFGQPGEGGVTARFLLAAPAGSGVLDNFAAGGRPAFGAGQGAGQGAAGQGGLAGGFAANPPRRPHNRGRRRHGDHPRLSAAPVSAAIDPEGTLLQVLTETPLTDLTPGGQVIITVGADGSAESIVAPPNLQSLLGGLFGGGQGGRGFGG